MTKNVENEAWTPTACNLCYANCGILVQTEGGRIVRVKGDKSHPASRGYTCDKAKFIDLYQNGRDRITTPLKRQQDGRFEPIDWDTALSEIATRLARVRDTHGGDKILRFGGAGQGNHLGNAYFGPVKAALGIKYQSNALAQEKTGHAWMMQRVFGTHVHGELDRADCLFIVGKNPWQSNGFQRARALLKEVSRDPERILIVMDPRRTETAELADIHLAVTPGRDAWALAAMIACIVQEDLYPARWHAEHSTGLEIVKARFAKIPVDDFTHFAGLEPALLRRAAHAIAGARATSLYEDLGVQMAPHSTLSSYLDLLLMALCGHYGRVGAMLPMKSLIGQFFDVRETGALNGDGYQTEQLESPVAGAPILSGLVPCAVIPDEVLTDHPARYRAMIIESSNPCHSMPDSPAWRAAMRALDVSVVIDVAMTETAREADYILPAASQYEKWEATFFNFENPGNVHHLRHPLFEPRQGTLPEPEIHARLVEALKPFDPARLAPLRRAARLGQLAYALRLAWFLRRNPDLKDYIAYILYRTLGAALPDGSGGAAVHFGLALRFALKEARATRRAGFRGVGPWLGIRLFRALLNSPSGVVFSVSDPAEAFDAIRLPGKKIHLSVREMLDELERLSDMRNQVRRDPDFPFLLSVGERRSRTANTIIRDPAWVAAPGDNALHVNPEDVERMGLSDGEVVRLSTRSGAVDVSIALNPRLQVGTLSLPNGKGLSYPDPTGDTTLSGAAPNELTDRAHGDPFVATPFHKHVPARIEPVIPPRPDATSVSDGRPEAGGDHEL